MDGSRLRLRDLQPVRLRPLVLPDEGV